MNRLGRKRQQPQMAGRTSKGSTAKVDFAAHYAEDEDDDKVIYRRYGKDKKSKLSNRARDETIDSDDSDSYLDEREYSPDDKDVSSSDESNRETIDEKKLRLAREYLHRVEQATKDEDDYSLVSSGKDSGSSDEDDDKHLHDKVSKRLSRDRLKKEGRLGIQIADSIKQSVDNIWMRLGTESIESIKDQAQSWVDSEVVRAMRGHDLTPTCVALHMPTGDWAYTGSKDGSVLMWDIERECRLHTIVPHWKKRTTDHDRKGSEVLSIACSDDG
jgi:ribosomal RNA-processing protein 9